ncbi:hypothetical protein DRQ26_04345 [bacterium]|nr:MAG: hypothetical protein DRQ26_04345 [bacterium]
MNQEFEDIRELFERTKPVLTARDGEIIRDGVWRKFRRHRTMKKVRVAIATVAVIVIAIVATLPHSPNENDNFIAISSFSDEELVEEIAQFPSYQVIVQLAGSDEAEIKDAILSEIDVESSVKALSRDEQEELLLAMSEM